MVNTTEDPRTTAKKDRLIFATTCVAAVFPGVKDEQQTKAVIFDKAARWGVDRVDCPRQWNTIGNLKRYIKNHWHIIRLMLPEQEDILPVYVNGAEFGSGGGYRKGDLKHARKQLERDAKIADGVVDAANDYADATGLVFPQIERTRRTLVNRQIGR